MTNELESMSYFMMVNLQWEHESCSSVEYDKPQFEQTAISPINSIKKNQIKTSDINYGDQLMSPFFLVIYPSKLDAMNSMVLLIIDIMILVFIKVKILRLNYLLRDNYRL